MEAGSGAGVRHWGVQSGREYRRLRRPRRAPSAPRSYTAEERVHGDPRISRGLWAAAGALRALQDPAQDPARNPCPHRSPRTAPRSPSAPRSQRPDAGPPSPPPTGAFQERVGPTMATFWRPGTSGPPSPHRGTSGLAAAAAHEATPAKPTRSGRSRAHLTGRGRDECSSPKRPRKQDLTFVGRGGLSRPSGVDRLPACSPGAVGGVAELGAEGERGGAGVRPRPGPGPAGSRASARRAAPGPHSPFGRGGSGLRPRRTPPAAGGAQGRRVPRAQACPPRLRAAGAKFPEAVSSPVKAPSAHSRLLPTRFFCVLLTMCESSFHLYLGGFRGQYIRSADTE